MTRRSLFHLVFAPVKPKHVELADRGNEFMAGFRAWSQEWNRTEQQGSVLNFKVVELFDPLPDRWRKFESAFRAYIRGF